MSFRIILSGGGKKEGRRRMVEGAAEGKDNLFFSTLPLLLGGQCLLRHPKRKKSKMVGYPQSYDNQVEIHTIPRRVNRCRSSSPSFVAVDRVVHTPTKFCSVSECPSCLLPPSLSSDSNYIT